MPIMVGINQAIKGLGVPTKYIPFINMALGLAIGIFYFNEDIKLGILNGLYLALGASGLFSSTKYIHGTYIKKDENKLKPRP